MTPEELDRWAAELMGWEIYGEHSPNPNYGNNKGERIIFVKDWHPSDPSTGQIWLVIEKMRELGWWLTLYQPDEIWEAKFSKYPENEPIKILYGRAKNPCLAILEAARAALK